MNINEIETQDALDSYYAAQELRAEWLAENDRVEREEAIERGWGASYE